MKRTTVNDILAFKITTAAHFLAKIPMTLPERDTQTIRLEVYAEAFLFFSSSVIDVIKKEINEKFQVFNKENVYYMHGFVKHLSDLGQQGEVKKAITRYFTTPTAEGRHVITKNSGLWKLQALRNQAMHGRVISMTEGMLCFQYTIRDVQREKPPIKFVQTTRNPNRYFSNMHADLSGFISRVRKTTGKNEDR